eukprot:1143217-Pleurochrysis_carterae.AAC.2
MKDGFEAIERYKAIEDGYKAIEDGYEAIEDGYKAIENGYKAIEDGYIAIEDGHIAITREGTARLDIKNLMAKERDETKKVITHKKETKQRSAVQHQRRS